MAEKKEKRYVIDNAQLMAEWDAERNSNINPSQVTLGSGRKVWWQCRNGHKWQATIAGRNSGCSCPYCSGKHAIKGKTDLQTVNSTLAKEWNHEKNIDLQPFDVTSGSDKKVWWKCEQGHEWQATISSRNSGCGCPYCAGIYVVKGKNDLQTINPDLAKEWDYEKNNGLTPDELAPFSSKKIWWKCHEGHSWQTSVSKRSSGQNCPFCSGKKAWKGYNDLATTNPELIPEWDAEQNSIPIYEYRPLSNKKVWWRCEKGHRWEAVIAKRVEGEKCPICQGKRILVGFNDLPTTCPTLFQEWDFDKNHGISPYEFSKGSDKKVWWRCKYNHSWEATISSRSSGIGCPHCAKELQTSFPEKALYFYVKRYFADTIASYRDNNLGNYEIDVFIPSLRVGIEYDGDRWHQRFENDLLKNEICSLNGIQLFRIREPACPILSDGLSYNIIMDDKKSGLEKAISTVLREISNIAGRGFSPDIDLLRDSIHILELVTPSEKKNNLFDFSPYPLDEWDYEKNGQLLPTQLAIGSDKKVWWRCLKGHSYISSVSSRTRGRGCPVCAGKIVLKGYNDFSSKCPELALEWDHQKNKLLPDEVPFGSDKKFWWQCAHGHSYESSINNRRAGQACPYCSGKKVLPGFNDIMSTHPEIAKQWDRESNEISPDTINAGSHKRVWWKCDICGYKWQSYVYNRCLNKAGCPHCSGRVKR